MSLTYVPIQSERILALDPVPRGFGFVVVERDPLRLVEWSVVSCRKRDNPHCLFVLGRLIERYDPSVLVVEDPRGVPSLRREVLGAFLDDVTDFVRATPVSMRAYSRREIREAFAPTGAVTKQEIAELLARRFPELASRVPPPRQIWQTEDTRMSIFDALSLGATHLASDQNTLGAAA